MTSVIGLVSGPATEMITGAKEALWLFDNEPGKIFPLRPYGLEELAHHLGGGP